MYSRRSNQMNQNRKRKIDASYIIQEGRYAIRLAMPNDATAYIARYNLPVGKQMRDMIISQKKETKAFLEDISNFQFVILEDGIVIGLIETIAKPHTNACEAYVEIFFPNPEDKMKKSQIQELFIQLLKEKYLYDRVWIYRTEYQHPLMTDMVDIAT